MLKLFGALFGVTSALLMFVSGVLLLRGCNAPPNVARLPTGARLPTSAAPAYNVLFSSRLSGSPNGLADHRPVAVSFYVGPRTADSAVPETESAVNPRLVSNLLVTLACIFCDSNKLQKTAIIWDSEKRESTKATFLITPIRQLIRNEAGKSDLIFQVSGATDGVLYDNVVVPVFVASGETTQHPFVESVDRPQGVIGTARAGSREVDLTITCFDSSGSVYIQLNPTDPELDKRFAGRHLGPDKLPRIFERKLATETLATIVASDFADLFSVVNNNKALQTALNGDPSQAVTLSSSQNNMKDSDRDALLKTFYSIGKDLYRRLFVAKDDTLAILVKEIDRYQRADHRPLRIRIEESQGVFVPWQFLHPLQETIDPKEFWGFKYELIVDPLGSQPNSNYPGPMKYKSGPLILAKYNADQTDSAGDKEVAALGDLHYGFLKSQVASNVLKVDTKQSFVDAIKKHLGEVQIIVAYTHADNGTILQPVPGSGDFTAVHLLSGAKLRFKRDQFISAVDLDSLPSTLVVPDIEMSERPLVFLNGCETSGGGYFATKDLNFPSIFLHFGARGVISTEAPVWDMFGLHFGQSLLTELKNAQPASLALLKARQQWLEVSHNPLGLLYSYYGGVDASVSFE